MDVEVLLSNSAAKKRKKFVSPAHQQHGAQRGKSPGRKVKVTDVITPPAAQTAEPDVQREIPAEWKFLAVGYNTGSSVNFFGLYLKSF